MAIALVRQLNEDHIQDLCALYQTMTSPVVRTPTQVRRMLAETDVVLGLVDDRSDRLVGCVRVLTDFVGQAFLLDLVVADSQQGLGLGRYLMDTVLQLPELRLVPDIRLYCLPEQVSFFEQWEFSPDLGGQVPLVYRP